MKKLANIVTFTLVLNGGLIGAPSAMAQPELKGSPDQLREFLHPRKHTISLSADAEKIAYSDKAYVSLEVTTEHKQLSKSIEANQRLRDSLIASLKDAGIKQADINNAKFSSSPQYGWFGDKPDSFEVSNTVTVGVSNEAHFLLLAKLSDEHKEVKIAATRFEHTQKDALKAEVRQMAMAKIQEQKAFYEQSLGVKLSAVSFNEGEVIARPLLRAQAPRLEKVQMSMSSAPAADLATKQASSFDEVKYSTQLFVQFEVEK